VPPAAGIVAVEDHVGEAIQQAIPRAWRAVGFLRSRNGLSVGL
jgi:hypothetical protein